MCSKALLLKKYIYPSLAQNFLDMQLCNGKNFAPVWYYDANTNSYQYYYIHY